jgi:excisionase family DNA binding protein
MAEETYRMGEAASALGVRVETLRRWERDKKLKTKRSSGGQRLVPAAEVARILNERRGKPQPTTMSARNHFPGVVTAVKKGAVAASVEILSGPHRIVGIEQELAEAGQVRGAGDLGQDRRPPAF